MPWRCAMAETALCIGLIAFWALIMWALTQLELIRAKRMIRDLEGDLVATHNFYQKREHATRTAQVIELRGRS